MSAPKQPGRTSKQKAVKSPLMQRRPAESPLLQRTPDQGQAKEEPREQPGEPLDQAEPKKLKRKAPPAENAFAYLTTTFAATLAVLPEWAKPPATVRGFNGYTVVYKEVPIEVLLQRSCFFVAKAKLKQSTNLHISYGPRSNKTVAEAWASTLAFIDQAKA